MNTITKFDLLAAVIIISLIVIIMYQHLFKEKIITKKSANLGVKELIEQVRNELLSIEKNKIDGVNVNIFQLKDFDLEVKFVVNEKESISGQVEFEMVTVGGESTITNEKVQTIKLHMTTIPPQQGEVGPPTENIKE